MSTRRLCPPRSGSSPAATCPSGSAPCSSGPTSLCSRYLAATLYDGRTRCQPFSPIRPPTGRPHSPTRVELGHGICGHCSRGTCVPGCIPTPPRASADRAGHGHRRTQPGMPPRRAHSRVERGIQGGWGLGEGGAPSLGSSGPGRSRARTRRPRARWHGVVPMQTAAECWAALVISMPSASGPSPKNSGTAAAPALSGPWTQLAGRAICTCHRLLDRVMDCFDEGVVRCARWRRSHWAPCMSHTVRGAVPLRL